MTEFEPIVTDEVRALYRTRLEFKRLQFAEEIARRSDGEKERGRS